jgi:hypothetical protein
MGWLKKNTDEYQRLCVSAKFYSFGQWMLYKTIHFTKTCICFGNSCGTAEAIGQSAMINIDHILWRHVSRIFLSNCSDLHFLVSCNNGDLNG